uniref:Si:ch211-239d6.2 n=1 Tax=Sinocyclocheilus grahami TaxID=75366 RepID=A0A672KVI1_SINGR
NPECPNFDYFFLHQLMNAVMLFVDGDRKGLENNIRVCLSSNSCFVKVPINPECPYAKHFFWKVDESKITPKILRRHFSGLRDVFPDFYENMEMSSVKNEMENRATCKRPEAENKFSSPFSIESLLQRESIAPLRNRPALCATRNLENAFVGLANGDHGLACKRKTWDWPHQTSVDHIHTFIFLLTVWRTISASSCLELIRAGC